MAKRLIQIKRLQSKKMANVINFLNHGFGKNQERSKMPSRFQVIHEIRKISKGIVQLQISIKTDSYNNG